MFGASKNYNWCCFSLEQNYSRLDQWSSELDLAGGCGQSCFVPHNWEIIQDFDQVSGW